MVDEVSSYLIFCWFFVELEDISLLDEMSESELDSTSLLLFDLPEDAVLLNLSRALFCLLFLECLVFSEDASLLDEMPESDQFTGGSCAFGLEPRTILPTLLGIFGIGSLLSALLGRFGLWLKFIIENVFRGNSF